MNDCNRHVRMDHKVAVVGVSCRPRPVVARCLSEAQSVHAAAIVIAVIGQRDCRLQRIVEDAAVRRLGQRRRTAAAAAALALDGDD